MWGEPQIKMIGNFWVLPRASLSSAAEAQVSFIKILRILSEMHSNFVQYTPQWYNEVMEKIRIEQHSSVGLAWIAGWLFTIGYLKLGFMQGLLGIFVWPYYLGAYFGPMVGLQ